VLLKKKLDYMALLAAVLFGLIGVDALLAGKAGMWWCPINGLQARGFGCAALLWALCLVFVTFRNRSRENKKQP